MSTNFTDMDCFLIYCNLLFKKNVFFIDKTAIHMVKQLPVRSQIVFSEGRGT